MKGQLDATQAGITLALVVGLALLAGCTDGGSPSDTGKGGTETGGPSDTGSGDSTPEDSVETGDTGEIGTCVLAEERYYPDADEEMQGYARFAYDEYGNVVDEWDYWGDGEMYYHEIQAYTYDDRGNMLEWTTDRYADGTLETIRTYTYDDGDRVLTTNFDNGANGEDSYDEWWVYTYDDRGNLINERAHSPDAWWPSIDDEEVIYTYDEDDLLLMEEFDLEADGDIDGRYVWTYDEHGWATQRDGYGADETVDESAYYDYDHDGDLVVEEYDWDADGVMDDYTEYVFDGYGAQVALYFDDGADGDLDGIWWYTLDDRGNRVRQDADTPYGDGHVDDSLYWTWDDHDNMTSETSDAGADGDLDHRYEYDWTCY